MATRLVLRKKLQRSMWDESENMSPDLLNDAIDNAIDSAWPSWFIVKQDTTQTIANDTFIYTLPSDCEVVTQVWLERGGSEPYRVLRNWRLAKSTATGTITKYLYLDNANAYQSAKTLKILYEASPPLLTDDTTETNVPTEFILAKGKSYLYEWYMAQAHAGHNVEDYKQLMAWNEERAKEVRARRGMQHSISHVHWNTSRGGVDIFAIPGVIDRYRP